jgi:Flp pilus assembly protein TadD
MVLAQLGREAEALRAIDQALAVDPTYSNAVKLRQSLVTKNDKEAKPS